jgi:hypothetical protein
MARWDLTARRVRFLATSCLWGQHDGLLRVVLHQVHGWGVRDMWLGERVAMGLGEVWPSPATRRAGDRTSEIPFRCCLR